MEDLLFVLIIVGTLVFFAAVIVVVSRINALHQDEHEIIHCPYCVTVLEPDAKFSDLESDRRGLLYCRQCDITFKLYTRQNGLSVLEEVFGTPITNETADDNSPVQDSIDGSFTINEKGGEK